MAERPEDLNLPNTVIARIIKEALPAGVNVSKDARLAISKAASVFVLYATSCANNFAMNAKRKTISPQDVLDAMKEMEFDRFVDQLQVCLEAYKKEQKEKKSSAEQRKRGERAEGNSEGAEVTEVMEVADDVTENVQTDDVAVQYVVTESDDVITQVVTSEVTS